MGKDYLLDLGYTFAPDHDIFKKERIRPKLQKKEQRFQDNEDLRNLVNIPDNL